MTKKEKLETKKPNNNNAEPKKEAPWKFKKGNTIGMETRFKPGHTVSTTYKSEYIDSMYNYFNDSDNIFPTLAGFAIKEGIAIKSISRWVNNAEKYPQLARTYEQCKAIQLQKLLEGGLTRQFDAQIVKFIAVNNHNMKEKVEQEVKADASFKVDISFFDEDSK